MSNKIETIIKKMSLEEKAALCTGASSWTTTPVDHLDVPELIMSDGPHGLRRIAEIRSTSHKSMPATCFPTASCLASTWDVDLLYKLGETLAEECLALDVDVLLGPGVNMKRSPLCGRNFEYFSEDPYLAGEMAKNWINGIQSKGIGVSLKHYATNNQEFQRFSINSEVDERTLREIYLPAFEKAVKDAKPWTVMCSYNKINGTYGSENHYLLNEILKDEWGFDGLVVSDWGAVHDRVAALKGGLDLEMPGPQAERVKAVVEAINAGELDEAVLDESVRRILGIVFKADETPKNGTFDVDSHHEMARKLASEGMVLLKNNGLLPLKGHKKIAVIGRAAQNAHFQGGGSSHINPTKVDVPLDEFKTQAGDAEVSFAFGYPEDNSFRQDMLDEAVSLAKSAEAAILYVALPTFKESEGYDRQDLDLTNQQVALIKAVGQVQPNTVVVLNNGAPVAVEAWIDDVAAILEGYMMGQAGGGAIADLLFGKVNPSGKLAETFPVKLSDTPAYLNWPGEAGKVRYGEGLFIGYRYYEAKEVPVRFPFGYGLSYTAFEYSNAKVSRTTFKDTEGVSVSVDVTNTGKVAGKEIVQVYVHDQKSSLVRPEKELKGFVKVELQPGETKTVKISLDFRAFAYYHTAYKTWITENGEFDLLIGASSQDIRAKLTVTLESSMELPCILNRESTVREWLEDPRGNQVFGPLFGELAKKTTEIFSGDEEARYGSDDEMGILAMIGDMPLGSVLRFRRDELKTHPREIVEDLLKKVYALE